jgi:hypothetical protein
MDRYPIPASRRHRFEVVIRVIDLVVYSAVTVGGVYALIGTPASVVDELRGAEWLIIVWAFLLLVGGFVGLIGRALRRWMIEVPATVLAFFGILIYLVILGRFALASITSTVATVLVLVAAGVMLRRWAELQIFSTDPDHEDFRSRVADALRRRTPNFAHRHQ